MTLVLKCERCGSATGGGSCVRCQLYGRERARELKTIAVGPIGTRQAYAHVNSSDPAKHGFRWIDVPVYPLAAAQAGAWLRGHRISLDLSLREAARALGIKPTELSEIERGARTCDLGHAAELLGAHASGLGTNLEQPKKGGR